MPPCDQEGEELGRALCDEHDGVGLVVSPLAPRAASEVCKRALKAAPLFGL
jgi:hypothetical protein